MNNRIYLSYQKMSKLVSGVRFQSLKAHNKNKKPENIDSQAFLMVRKSFRDFFTFNKDSVCG